MRRGVAYASEAGQTLVEYALLAALVGILGVGALGVIHKAVGGVQVQTCRDLACPDGYASNKGRSCDDPPVICGASAP